MAKTLDIPTPDLLDYFKEMCDEGDKDYCEALEAFYERKTTTLPVFEKVGQKPSTTTASSNNSSKKGKGTTAIVIIIIMLILLAVWYYKFYKKGKK